MKKILFYFSCILCIIFSHGVSAQEEKIILSSDLAKESCHIANDILIDTMAKINRNELNTEILIKNYCQGLNSVAMQCKQTKHQIYDASQSVFLYYLCEAGGANIDMFSKNLSTDGYLKKDSIDNLKIIGFQDLKYDCSPYMTNMNGCDIHRYFPKLLQMIYNDLFNIKQVQLFGVKDIKEDYEDKANNYSEQYFGTFKICKSDNYKRTCNVLKDFIRQAEAVTKKTDIIDIKKLSKKKKDCSNIDDSEYDILYCGLLGDQIYSDLSFINILYNELYWYSLFADYYSIYAQDEPSRYIAFEDRNKSVQQQRTSIQQKIYIYNENSLMLQKGISLAIQKLQDIKNTFPLHIGLLMYQEDLASIRNAIGNMYTPIRTLFDKLRNVQDLES